ncbi:DNA ligase, partial [Bienertia sinuspersici]
MATRTIAQMPWSIASLSKRQTVVHVSSLKFKCSSSVEKPRKLILYSKPGCCLLMVSKRNYLLPFLTLRPQIPFMSTLRDITTNPDWERAYQYEIPVLAKLRADGTE